NYGAEPVVEQRPRRVFARRAASKVATGHQDSRIGRCRIIEREIASRLSLAVEAPVGKEMRAEAHARRGREKARRDDLVRVDVIEQQERCARGQPDEWFCDHIMESLSPLTSHRSPSSVRASVIRPVTAAAAAVSGLARNVRPPAPCRPSKLRLLVLTAYWPGRSRSSFLALHIEPPGPRHPS